MDHNNYKRLKSYEARCEEANTMLQRFPGYGPVIVQRDSKSTTLPEITRPKFLVPSDIDIGNFIFVIRKRLELNCPDAIFLFVGPKRYMPCQHTSMGDIYRQYRDSDGFVYMTYSSDVAFG